MTKIALLSASLPAMLALSLPAAPARAQNGVSYVASVGNGTACSRTAPCGDFASAITATVAGGSINCLDAGPLPRQRDHQQVDQF